MRVKITANYPESEVKALLVHAARSVGLKHAGLAVYVRNRSTGISGRACNYVYSTEKLARGGNYQRVILSIGREDTFPSCINNHGQKQCLNIFLADWREALVYLAGHEFGHILFFQMGKRQGGGEVSADWHGYQALKEYRAKRAESNITIATETIVGEF